MIVLGGAVFVRSLSLHGAVVRADEPLLIKAMRVLQMVGEAHRLGRPINESKVFRWINSDVYNDSVFFERWANSG